MGGDVETINTLYWMWKTLLAAEMGVWVGMFLVTWNCGKRGRTAWVALSCCTTWYLYTFSQQKLFQLYKSWKEYENALDKNLSLNNYEVPDWLTSELDAIVYLPLRHWREKIQIWPFFPLLSTTKTFCITKTASFLASKIVAKQFLTNLHQLFVLAIPTFRFE